MNREELEEIGDARYNDAMALFLSSMLQRIAEGMRTGNMERNAIHDIFASGRHYSISHQTQSDQFRAIRESESVSESVESTRPTFIFPNTTKILYDSEKSTVDSILEEINQNKTTKIEFTIVNQHQGAYGKGATKFVYDIVNREFVDKFMTKNGGFFVDVRDDWSEETAELFVRLVAMTIASDSLFPYHFSPGLLEIISRKKLFMCELEFYLELIDPTVYEMSNKMSAEDFNDLGLSDGKEEYYRSIVVGTVSEKMMTTYELISKNFELFDAMYHYDTITIDRTFSGVYRITSQTVIDLCVFTNESYREMWLEFVNSLTEKELRQMLMAFGNSVSVENKYFIFVSGTISADISIATCTHKVTLHERLFQDAKTLSNLKLNFISGDTISDGDRESAEFFHRIGSGRSGLNRGMTGFGLGPMSISFNMLSDPDRDSWTHQRAEFFPNYSSMYPSSIILTEQPRLTMTSYDMPPLDIPPPALGWTNSTHEYLRIPTIRHTNFVPEINLSFTSRAARTPVSVNPELNHYVEPVEIVDRSIIVNNAKKMKLAAKKKFNTNATKRSNRNINYQKSNKQARKMRHKF